MDCASSTTDNRYLLLRIRTLAETSESATLEIEGQVDYRTFFPAASVQLDLQKLRSTATLGDNEYGRYLSGRLASCLPVQLALGNVSGAARLRFQLLLDPSPGIHQALRWERLEFAALPGGCLAVRSDIAFSRFTAVNRAEIEPPANDPFHLLAIVASPKDDAVAPIDATAEFRSLLEACGGLLENQSMRLTLLPGRQTFVPDDPLPKGVRIVEGPTTLQSVGRLLSESEWPVHGLHILAHGTFNALEQIFYLLLEDDKTDVISPATSAELIDTWRPEKLRLVLAQSCQSATAANNPRERISSFIQDLVEAGVPGVIAMQDFIRMDAAREFNRGFYSSLLRDGTTDEAVNAGRARLKNEADEAWSIPVFATRLTRAALWRQSPIRSAQQKLRNRLAAEKESQQQRDFPIDVVRVNPDMLARVPQEADDIANIECEGSPSVAALDTIAQVTAATKTQFYCLVGQRGRAKTSILETALIRAMADYVEGKPGSLSPLAFLLADCAQPTYDAENMVARAIARHYDARAGAAVDLLDLQRRFEQEAFLFLVDGSDLAGNEVRNALQTLTEFAKRQGHRFVVALDQSGLRLRDLPEAAECLIVQPMRAERVRAFLLDSKPGSPDRKVKDLLDNGALYDLAEVPWLLREMLQQARRGVLQNCRAKIIERVVRDGINRFHGSAGSTARVEEALQQFAWELLQQRTSYIAEPEAFQILARLRGNRDYPLFNFLASMVDSCNILTVTGENKVGFNYPGFRSYCGANYLLTQPPEDRAYLLEEITAQLGRQSRAKRWSEVLFVLAGLWKETSTLLRMILSGSPLHQGDQVFIAARCLQEARLAFGGKPDSQDPTVRSIVGTLVRLASTMTLGSATARAKAISYLGPLREAEAVPHLIALVLDKVRSDKTGQRCYDYSSVRFAAVRALLYTKEVVEDSVAANASWRDRPGLGTALQAWRELDGAGLASSLETAGDSSVAALSAFALGLTYMDGAYEALCKRFLRADTDTDTLWAIADSLLEMGPPDCSEFLRQALGQADRALQVAYLIGKLGMTRAGPTERQFLKDKLEGGDLALRGQCLHSLAELGDVSVLPLCHQWLNDPSPMIQYYALQALRHIGTAETLRELEKRQLSVRWDESDSSNDLLWEELCVDVYENIYWRLAGGLSRETMIPIQSSS